ncbi:MAG: aminotransferase [Deltaproteobacteria bacterium]|jgi:aspartate/methionine/tyrosine aminotransferase|nr:aminotransferase [Deltaproteobacteria bacterium]
MRIEEFGVERWMDLYETRCEWNLAETSVDSLTLGELLSICGRGGKEEELLKELLEMRLTYGAIPGSLRLRRAISALYQTVSPEEILIAHGAIGANALVYQALVDPGDHVVAVAPTYQQHHSIPESLGAEVDALNLAPERSFLPDPAELKRLMRPNTKLLALNNPNNPSGSLIKKDLMEALLDIAAKSGAWVLCDEVYRGLDDDGDGFSASAADLYEKAVSTGSMSKAYSLAGLRLGWLAGRAPGLIQAVMTHRDYNTISVGMIDDLLASIALESFRGILDRNQNITRVNRSLLAGWIEREPLVGWTPPRSGTTALLKLLIDVPSWDFCVRLVEETGVMLTPGSAMGMEGYLRIGYACSTSVLANGLKLLTEFLRRNEADFSKGSPKSLSSGSHAGA